MNTPESPLTARTDSISWFERHKRTLPSMPQQRTSGRGGVRQLHELKHCTFPKEKSRFSNLTRLPNSRHSKLPYNRPRTLPCLAGSPKMFEDLRFNKCCATTLNCLPMLRFSRRT